MIISNNNRAIKTNLKNSTQFSVTGNSSKLFSMLSNVLYKDKERAVITELASNAVDAHTLVGKQDIPITVTLPTELQKELHIRDYGPGLSEEEVYEYLTKYGSSSKTDTNDFIGGYGIGSKSPAAVTDTWNIISYHNSTETNYLVHVNAHGIPSINKLYSKPTTECGLHVIVPTKTVYEWHKAARDVFMYYDVKPTFLGTNIDLPKLNTNSFFDGLYSLNAAEEFSASITVIMNKRCYKLDMIKLDIMPMFDRACFIQFSTASLNVNLAREDLHYDVHTVASVKDRISNIKKCLVEEWKKSVSDKTDVFNYQLAAKSFIDVYHITPEFAIEVANINKDKFINVIDFYRLFKFNIKLDNSYAPHFIQFCYKNVDNNIVVSKLKPRATQYNYSFWPLNVNYNNVYNYKNRTQEQFLSFDATNKESIVFIERDIKNALMRVKYALKTGKIPLAIILDKNSFDLIPTCFTKFKASQLDKLPRIAKIDTKNIESEYYIKDGNKLSRVNVSYFDYKKKWVYVYFKRMNTISSVIDKKEMEILNFIGKNEIVFIKPGTVAPNWAVSAATFIEQEYELLYKEKDSILKATISKDIKRRLVTSLLHRMMAESDKFTSIDKNSVFGEIVRELSEANEFKSQNYLTPAKNVDTFNMYCKYLGKDDECINIQKISYYDYMRILTEAYPLLKYIDLGYDVVDTKLQHIIQYVKLCGN